MQRFASQARVLELREESKRDGLAGLRAELELAWHLRQRDAREALSLVEKLGARVAAEVSDGPERQRLVHRLDLTAAEVFVLTGETAKAEALLEQLSQSASDDALIASDVNWVRVGMLPISDSAAHLRVAAELAAAAGDWRRAEQARAGACVIDAVWPGVAARPHDELRADIETLLRSEDEPAQALALEAQSCVVDGGAETPEGLALLLRAAQVNEAGGNVRRGFACAINIAEALVAMQEHREAAHWYERSLSTARQAGWPEAVAFVLCQMADVVCELGEFEQGEVMAAEAAATLRELPQWGAGQQLAHAVPYVQAKVALSAGRFDEARRLLDVAAERCGAAHDEEFLWRIRLVQGLACAPTDIDAAVGHVDAAEKSTAVVHSMARQAQVMFTRFRILAQHALAQSSPSAEMVGEALKMLEQACQAGLRAPGSRPTSAERSLAADLCERIGDTHGAYEHARAALRSETAQETREAKGRLIAMRTRHQISKAQIAAEFAGRLAEAERQRAADLHEMNERLRAANDELSRVQKQLKSANAALEEVSLTDPLTGLRNRRFLEQAIVTDMALLRSRRTADERRAREVPDRVLCFLLVDLDHFKSVNDTYGHAAGDAVLVQMRERLAAASRESDYLVRWGGEEFLVVARDILRNDAPQVAERLRTAVASRPFQLPDGRALPTTCSIGFCALPFNQDDTGLPSWERAVDAADESLYEAKHNGRNAWVGISVLDSFGIADSPFATAKTRDVLVRSSHGALKVDDAPEMPVQTDK